MSLIVKEKCSIEEVTVEVTLRFIDGKPDNELTAVLADFLPEAAEDTEPTYTDDTTNGLEGIVTR